MKICPKCNNMFPDSIATCLIDGAELVERQDPLIGRLVGGCYRVISKLAAGGMGDVYVARHEYMNREVAIKALKPTLAMDEEFRQRTFREARICATIEHRNIVEVFDMVMSENQMCIVMELLEGETLKKQLGRGRQYDVPTVLSIMSMTAEALSCAHSVDVVHRDIKPSNILLTRFEEMDDFVKLLDFGIAYALKETRLTASGTVMGTPPYMSPELFKANEPTKASDIYSLACVMYKLLTGRSPFQSPELPAVVKGHLEELHEPLQTYRPEVPDMLEVIFSRMLEKNPEDRYSDAFELLHALKSSGLYVYGAEERDSVTEILKLREGPGKTGWTSYFEIAGSAEREDTGSSESLSRGIEAASELREIEAQKKAIVEQMEAVEGKRRKYRKNISNAISTLNTDLAAMREANARGKMDVLKARSEKDMHTERVRDAAEALSRAIDGRDVDEAMVEMLKVAGEAAKKYEEVAEKVEALQRMRGEQKETLDDLKFQIMELHRRIREVDDDCVDEYDGCQRRLEELSARGEALRQEAADAAVLIYEEKRGEA